MSDELFARKLLERAGIEVGGPNPYDIHVYDPRFYPRALTEGSLGLGEGYMQHWWDCEDLAEFFNRVLRANLPDHIGLSAQASWLALRSKLFNLQSRARAAMVAHEHYDLPSEIYDATLDETHGYTCGLWDEEITTLEEAQIAKYDRACRNLGLKEGDRLLDIGFGWAGLMAHAKKEYGAVPTGISMSEGQTAWARRRYKDMPMDFRIQDYRSLEGEFDHVASIEMIEAVGRKYLRTYFRSVHKVLVPKGKFVLQAIVGQKQNQPAADTWIEKYIFRNGELPTLPLIFQASHGLFNTLSVDMFGHHYDKTLLAWNRRFQAKRSQLKERFGEPFCRMWEYYLLSCAGAYRAEDISVGQITFEAR